MRSQSSHYDLICFSHLRWDFVYQRPQHLMTRFSDLGRVYFVEEPIRRPAKELKGAPTLEIFERENGVRVIRPIIQDSLSSREVNSTLTQLLQQFFLREKIHDYIFWYYTPMAVPFTTNFTPLARVYDCMDELSQFKGAPSELVFHERELFRSADLVFTGGFSLFESKQKKHPRVFCFPSSIDYDHFSKARSLKHSADYESIPRPRLGFYGVIDERMDLNLINSICRARPEWSFVLLGPIVKIEPSSIPFHPNLYLLGRKTYQELPLYLHSWDIAFLPFAKNPATEFISPTKTPEYLAAGKPTISTSIRDVVRPYGMMGLVEIADNAEQFVEAAEKLFQRQPAERRRWLKKVDKQLEMTSWDQTWSEMASLIDQSVFARRKPYRSKAVPERDVAQA